MKEDEIEDATEALHPWSAGMDALPLEAVIRLVWDDHRGVMDAIGAALPQIASLTRVYAETYRAGGRIFYVGAGTSGRLGLLDAAELPPTFGIPKDRVQAIIAGGEAAVTQANEAAEDNKVAGKKAIIARGIGQEDLVIAVSASGQTPFVLGAMAEARARGAKTAGITNNFGTVLEQLVEYPIVIATGPELIAGSTRLKAGTAQKIVLNMLSTVAMIQLGKVYDGFMVDLRVTNRKLHRRAERMLTHLTGERPERIREVLVEADWRVKPALVMLKGGVSYEEAVQLLQKREDSLRKALAELDKRGSGL